MKNYFLAITTLMGTIIGVGVFSLPYIINKSGVLPFLFFIPVLTVIQYYLHLYFAEIVLSTKGDHRLPGFVEKYFGHKGKTATLLAALFSDYGVMISYIIIGGLFLHELAAPVFGGSVLFYTLFLFCLEAAIVYNGLKSIANSEFVMTAILITIMGIIIFKGSQLAIFGNYTILNLKNMFLPYGPVFFAIGGAAAIPEVCKLLAGEPKKIKGAIAWATFGSALLIFLFAFTVAGITGQFTTPDALVGLKNYLNPDIVKMALLFGLLVIVTSMITIAQASREILWWDFKFGQREAWALTFVLPLWLYLTGIQNFTKTVSLTGAVSGGILGIIMIMLLLKIKTKCEQDSVIKCRINKTIAWSLSLFFVLGFLYEVWNVFFNKM